MEDRKFLVKEEFARLDAKHFRMLRGRHLSERAQWFYESDALVYASYLGDRELFDELLARATDVNVQDENGCAALHQAAKEGYGSFVQELIDAGADVMAKDANGDMPHDYANFYGHLNIASTLVQAGAVARIGQSFLDKQEDAVYAAFADADPVKTLVAMINDGKESHEH